MKILNTTPMQGIHLKSIIESMVPGLPFTVTDAHLLPDDALRVEIADAGIVLGDYTGSTPITRRVVEAAGSVRLIQQPSVGYNHIDVAACTEFGIPVANTPGANDIGVAEHTIMLAMASLKNLPFYNAKTHQGEWMFMHAQQTGIFELHGKTYGLLGMGSTARAVAGRLLPFGVRLLYYSHHRLAKSEEEKYSVAYASLDDLLKLSDIVSLHLPLTEKTADIISAERLTMMKPTAVLINLGRGPLVDSARGARRL